MSKHTLNIDFECSEGAMVRLLGLVQRRGFTLCGMNLPAGDEVRKTATLTVSALNPNFRIDILQRQIERLQEVHGCSLANTEKQGRNIFNLFFPSRLQTATA